MASASKAKAKFDSKVLKASIKYNDSRAKEHQKSRKEVSKAIKQYTGKKGS